MARPPSANSIIKNMRSKSVANAPLNNDFIIPNHSGDLSAGKVNTTPTQDLNVANKKYVDDALAGIGAVDWTVSQAPTVIHADNYVDNNTTYVAGDFSHNSLAGLNDGTDYEHITQAQKTALHDKYTDAEAVTAIATADKYLKNDASDTSTGTITAAEFVDSTTSGTSTEWEAAYNHSQDNTQAHSDYLLNSGADSAVGPLTITADNSSADTAYVPMVLYNTDATPPAANTVPVGTIYIQYTA